MKKNTIVALLGSFLGGLSLLGQPVYHSYHKQITPDNKNIIFSWKGDLWEAPITGGTATSLTQTVFYETDPCISKDGRYVYYLSEKEDTSQIYEYDRQTGNIRKITSHSESFSSIEQVFPDGKSLLVYAYRDQDGWENGRFLKVSIEDGREEMIFNDYGGLGSLSPDGKKLLFTREMVYYQRFGYHGSKACQIWLYDLEAKTFQRVFDCDYSVEAPIWCPDGHSFYYINSVSGIGNIHHYDFKTGQDRALTSFKDAPVAALNMSADGTKLTFQVIVQSYVLDTRIARAEPQKINFDVKAAATPAETQRRTYTTLQNFGESGTMNFSPNATEVVLSTGGDLYVMDTNLRKPIAITNSSKFIDKEAVFSLDHKKIYFLRDDGISVNIWMAERTRPDKAWWENTEFKLTPLTNDKETRYFLSVSPVGNALLWIEDRGRIVVSDMNAENQRELYHASAKNAGYEWAPDGKWIVTTIHDDYDNLDVWILSTTGEREPFNLSRHTNYDGQATWSPDGKIITFLGARYDNTVKFYYVYLNPEDELKQYPYENKVQDARNGYYPYMKQYVEPPPPPPAQENAAQPQQAEAKPQPAAAPQATDEKKVVIDFTNLEKRVRAINMNAEHLQLPFWSHDSKKFAFVATINGKFATWYITFPYNLQNPQLLFNEVGGGATWLKDGRVAWIMDSLPAINNHKLDFKIYKELNQKDYYRLAFRVAWRGMRDNFYDPTMKGVDWEGVLQRYEELAANAEDIYALCYLVNHSQSTLNASHLSFIGNVSPRRSANRWSYATSHTGMFFDETYQGDGLLVKKVVKSLDAATAPNCLKPGDIVLEIDGVKVNSKTNLIPILTQEPGHTFKYLVKQANGVERELYIPFISYGAVRQALKAERYDYNQQMVETLSNGRIGYLNIEVMDATCMTKFEQEVYARTFDKDALIIDVRNNGGGYISDKLLSILCHPQHAYTIPRKGNFSYPIGYVSKPYFNKPLIVLCNQNTCSNAEIFTHAIKTLKRGKVVGVPTQACVISTPKMKVLDLAEMAIPDRGWWTMEGIDMDLQGAIPDVIIWPQPTEIPEGIDKHLEKAVELLQEEIKVYKKETTPPTLIWAREGYEALNKK